MTSAMRRKINLLRCEAAEAGDTKQVALCTKALEGDIRALKECQKVMV